MPLKSLRNQIIDMLPTVLGVCLILYLIFHILSGQRGLLAYPERVRALEAAKTTLHELEETRHAWEIRTKSLRMEGLDLDMLEERARAMLNFTRPDEAVILLKPQQ